MTWLITLKPTYLFDYADLPRDMRGHVTLSLIHI